MGSQRDTRGSKSRDKGVLMILKDGKNDLLRTGRQAWPRLSSASRGIDGSIWETVNG